MSQPAPNQESLLERIMETSPAGIVVFDLQGRITFANAQAEKVLGLARENILQRTYNDPAWHITRYDGSPFPEEELPFAWVLATGQPVYDVHHAIERPDGQQVLLSVNAAPLLDEAGKLSGIISAIQDVTEQIQAEQALQKAYQALEQRNRELEALHMATTMMVSTLDLRILLDRILAAAVSAVPQTSNAILVAFDLHDQHLRFKSLFGVYDPALYESEASLEEGSLISQAMNERRPIYLADVGRSPIFKPSPQLEGIAKLRSALIAPLVIENRPLGAILLLTRQQNAYNEGYLNLLVSFASFAAAALNNAQLHAEVQAMAIVDPLTQLYNRRGFFEIGQREIERSKRDSSSLCIIMLDTDQLKRFNDTYGHGFGDRVLVTIADQLRNNLRRTDLVGRIGGDEFAVVLPKTTIQNASLIAQRMLDSVHNAMLLWRGKHVPISVSIGLAPYDLTCRTLEDVLLRADQALYKAKQSGRNCFATWESH